MSIVNFRKQSQEKLRILVGRTATEEDRRRERTSDTFVEKNYYKVTEIVTGTFIGSEDTYTEYKAVQVDPDGTEVENGVIFDSDQTPTNDIDKPTYLSNLQINEELFSGTVELDKAYQVEEIDGDEFGDDPQYFIIPKGGAGGGSRDFYFQIVSKDDSFLQTNSYYAKYSCYLYNNLDFNFYDRSGLEDVYLPRYFEKFGVLPIGYKHGYVSKDSFTDNYIFKELDVLGNATIISGQGTSYDADIKVGNYTIPSVNVRARNIGFGDLLPTQSFQCKFGVEVNDSSDGQWYINPATFGTSDSGFL